MGRRGTKRQLEVEARNWALLSSGAGTVAACRAVGITRKTGYRWRAEAVECDRFAWLTQCAAVQKMEERTDVPVVLVLCLRGVPYTDRVPAQQLGP